MAEQENNQKELDVGPDNADASYHEMFNKVAGKPEIDFGDDPEEEEKPTAEAVGDKPESEQEPEPLESEEAAETASEATEGDEGKDWRSTLTDEAREHLEALEQAERESVHKQKSANGRISALAKQVDGLKATLASRADTEQESAPTKGFVPPDPEDETAWKELMEQYPQLAKQFDKRIVDRLTAMGVQLQETEKGKAEASPNVTQTDGPSQEYLNEQRDKVQEVYPNYLEIGQSQFFNDFLGTLTENQRALASSNEAADVISLIRDLYTPYYYSVYPQDQQGSGGDKSGEAVKDVDAEEKARRAKDRKQKALEDTEVRGTQPRFTAQGDLEDDGTTEGPGPAYSNLFDKLAKQKAKAV